MTTCTRSDQLVSALHDGELPSPLRREVASHVSDCAVCIRRLTALDRVQELLVQAIDDEFESIDFSGFWAGVTNKLQPQPPPWASRLQMWWTQWRLNWPLAAPLWAAAALIAALLVPRAFQSTPTPIASSEIITPAQTEPVALAANQQAHIESLAAAGTVALWNEPTSNSTVIWVADGGDGGTP